MTSDLPSSPLARSLDMTLAEWVEHYQANVVMENVRYRGVLTWKNVLDLWVIQEILHDTQPEIVVEIGCRFGGTTLWLSDNLSRTGGSAVVSVDLTQPKLALPPNVHFVQGDSVAAATFDKVNALSTGRRTMVMLDGNHAAEHVLRELHLYGTLVAEGCYLIVEDGIVDVMPWPKYQPGPLVAVRNFLATNNDFVVDQSREKFILTYAPSGFLRRVRN